MRVLFAANELHFPDNMGGSRMDVHDLAITLQEQGHQVAVVAILRGRNRLLGYRALETLTGRCLLHRVDTRNGYETFRCGSWQIRRFLRAAMARDVPGLLIAQGPGGALLAREAARRGCRRSCGSLRRPRRNCSPRRRVLTRGSTAAIRDPLVTVVAVSRFVATLAEDQMDISPAVIYPPVRLQACTAQDREPEHITFVNPIPMKGLDLALRVADLLPHRRFLFVEAWNMRGDERAALDREVSRRPNVNFQPRSPGLAERVPVDRPSPGAEPVPGGVLPGSTGGVRQRDPGRWPAGPAACPRRWASPVCCWTRETRPGAGPTLSRGS